MNPDVSVVTINYNHGEYLDAYIQSLLTSEYPIAEIIVVDNHSTDCSLDILEKYHDRVRCIRNIDNIGYSRALNQVIHQASSPLVCATGPDIVVPPDWLRPLVDQYLLDPENTFAVASQVFMLDRKTVQSSGGSLHYTGHLIVYDMWKDSRVNGRESMPVAEVGAIDSTSVLFDREKYIRVGGCDPTFFVYHEEFDYCYRARMRGWRCWYQPQSRVFHGGGTTEYSSRHTGSYPSARPYLHTRNRWTSIIKNYQLRTILSFLPAMLIVEVLNLALLARIGLLKSYFSAWKGLWQNRREIFRNRQLIQSTRRLSDGLLLGADPLTISPILINSPMMNRFKTTLDRFLALYWKVLKTVLYP